MRLRAGRSSRAESAAAVLGLIILSMLMMDIFDTSNLVNPLVPRNASPAPSQPAPASPGPGFNGTLVISVTSNQNATNRFAPPTNTSSGAEGAIVLATFVGATPPSQTKYLWITNAQGLAGCIQCLPVGPYVVSIRYGGFNTTIPADVFAYNQTLVRVSITGRMYPLIYSKESGVLVTPTSAQYTLFAQVRSRAPVANASQPVFLTVSEGASGVGAYSVNATVISLGAPSVGTQWLRLGTPSLINLVDATSISMTVWTSSTNTTIGPITYPSGLLRP